MRYYKSSALLILITLLTSYSVQANFTLEACLSANSDLTIAHKVKPFGLLERSLSLKKEKCIIDVTSISYKFIKKSWQVDVCRSPIHIKKTDGGVEVVKKEGACETSPSSDFCQESDNLIKALQDDGLIFAEGEKANLSDDHGKVNCAFLLLEEYLRKNRVFGEMTSFEATSSAAQTQSEKMHSLDNSGAPVPVYKDSSNPELETSPAESQAAEKKEDPEGSSNISW